MATVVASLIEPDETAIKEHLETLFEPAREDYPQGLLELRFGQGTELNRFSYFNIREDGLAEAASFAANRNREGCNVYIGVNPRRSNTNRRQAAADRDVEVAFWQFADLDDEHAVAAAGKRLAALPPYFTVNTGTVPHRRPHLYWLLDEPVYNMPEWTARQKGIAQSLDGDSVINPSRIMRLAGTVNFPALHKLQRGYKVERTTLRSQFEDERAAVTPDQVAHAFPVSDYGKFEPNRDGKQTTLQAMRGTQVADLLDACRSGDQWHNNMVRLTAHLAGKGRSSAEIIGLADHITLPGYTVDQTVQEMAKALDGARSKYGFAEPQDGDVEAEECVREEADAIFELLDMDELEAMPPPSWLIHETVVDDGLTILYGDPGAGKSFIALDMALRLSMGLDWHGKTTTATGVLYIAGEGARGLGKRIKGWRREHRMEGVDAPFLLLPVAVELLDEKQRAKLLRTIDAAVARAGFRIGLVVVDTVSRALAGSDENGQEAMGQFVAACDVIKRHAGGALIGVHHSGKDKERGMRGSTVLLGACDASIRITKDGQIAKLETEKQKDAEQSEPIYMEMRKVTWATGLEEEQSTLVPFRSEEPWKQETEKLTREQIATAFGMMADAWASGWPMSHRPETRKDGRYAPAILAGRLGGDAETWADHVRCWLENGNLVVDICDRRTKAKGLHPVDPIT